MVQPTSYSLSVRVRVSATSILTVKTVVEIVTLPFVVVADSVAALSLHERIS